MMALFLKHSNLRLAAPGLLLVLALGLITGCERSPSAAGTGQKYHCPMHPTYVSDRQGDCPICNMKLVPIKAGESVTASKGMRQAPDSETAHIKPGQYYCPMDREVVREAPGTCPECNMKLIQKPLPGAEELPPPPGRTTIALSPEKRQLIGLKVDEVKSRDLQRVIRTWALVEHDETKYTKIAPRFSGWVHSLNVNYTGAPVESGQPLLTVYSPELFAAENEYLVAWRSARELKENASPEQKESANALLESARLRLALFQIGDEEIRQLEQSGKARAELLFRAPFSGHVLVKNAVEGAAFQAGETLYEIADLHHVWLRAYVYEFELAMVSVGQDATIHFPYLGNKTFEAKLTFIYPHIEPQTRRAQLRLELDNPEHLLRPDMWANVEIKVNPGPRLSVPASAILDTGERFIAFVDGPDNHLEPRQVKVGLKTDDYYEVLGGLKDGEKVVSRALFLVDSESQLKAAIAGMTGEGGHAH